MTTRVFTEGLKGCIWFPDQDNPQKVCFMQGSQLKVEFPETVGDSTRLALQTAEGTVIASLNITHALMRIIAIESGCTFRA